MSTRYAFVDDSGETRLSGFLQPDPGGGSIAVLGTYNAEILYNSDNTGPGYTYDVYGVAVLSSGGGNQVSTFVIPGMAITAGQTLKLIAKCNEDDGLIQYLEGALTVASLDGADWLSVYKFNALQPITTAYTGFEFDTDDDPAGRGTKISWDAGTPDTVTITADGIFTVSGKLIIAAA